MRKSVHYIRDIIGRRLPTRKATCLWRDRAGASALEFALVGPIALTMILATIQISLIFQTQLTLDFALASGARQVQIGTIVSADQYRSFVCSRVSGMPDCQTALNIVSKAGSKFSALDGSPFNVSGAYGLITASYSMPWIISGFKNITGRNSTTLVSSVAFKNEPF